MPPAMLSHGRQGASFLLLVMKDLEFNEFDDWDLS
jgi:hypothetical protein